MASISAVTLVATHVLVEILVLCVSKGEECYENGPVGAGSDRTFRELVRYDWNCLEVAGLLARTLTNIHL